MQKRHGAGLSGRLDLAPEEARRLAGILRVVLEAIDPSFPVDLNELSDRLGLTPEQRAQLRAALRTNVTAIARELGKSRRTLYNWAERLLQCMVETLRGIRVGRPPRAGRN